MSDNDAIAISISSVFGGHYSPRSNCIYVLIGFLVVAFIMSENIYAEMTWSYAVLTPIIGDVPLIAFIVDISALYILTGCSGVRSKTFFVIPSARSSGRRCRNVFYKCVSILLLSVNISYTEGKLGLSRRAVARTRAKSGVALFTCNITGEKRRTKDRYRARLHRNPVHRCIEALAR